MTTIPDSPLNRSIPLPVEEVIPDTLTLLSLIREDISNAITPSLSRKDEKAYVLVSSVSNGVFLSALALSKTGEYRFVDIELSTMIQMWQLKGQQYKEQAANNYRGEHQQDAEEKGGWLSMLFTIDNDGFVAKTSYNYDKRIYSGPTPEQWFIAPEEPTEDYKSVWSDEEYLSDLEQFPRVSGKHEWLS